jgi:UMF1 family MFS transporter
MLGKFATILGPVLIGTVGLIARRILMPPTPTPEQILHVGQLASRLGIASIAILFIVGGVLFFFVDEDRGRIEASYLSEV